MKLRLHTLDDTDLELSTFCCGLGDLFARPPGESDALLDAFVEAGGNFFDSAHCYSFWLPGGNGLSEIRTGDYLRRRGLSGQVTVATKGAHPSAPGYRTVTHHLSPQRIGADIDDSLGRLQCDTIALYYLHRDDEGVPVDEIIDALNLEIVCGRVRYLGASNWSPARIAEANAYARAQNLAGFVISQPRWSLATQQSDPAFNADGDLEWYRQNGLALAPYSPTAHGFFDGCATADYQSPHNQARRERALELAQQHGATPGQINLAYLIGHEFPVFPILGTKNPDRLRELLAADALALTSDELRWLAQG